jgi:ribonuclease HI
MADLNLTEKGINDWLSLLDSACGDIPDARREMREAIAVYLDRRCETAKQKLTDGKEYREMPCVWRITARSYEARRRIERTELEGLQMIGYFDGASRGNPGPSAAGAVIKGDDGVVWTGLKLLPNGTNNEAEYRALIFLLENVRRQGIKTIQILGDSQLVIQQVTMRWRVNEPRLKELAEEVWRLEKGISASYQWIPREKNALADSLSGKAFAKKNGTPGSAEQ